MWPQYQQWKRDLTGVTPYWDFSGYNQIARTDTMFMDILHVKPEAGMTILRRLLGDADPQCRDMQIVLDAGLWMDSRDVDRMLAIQDQREQAAIAEPTKYEEVVKRAIRQWNGESLTSASR